MAASGKGFNHCTNMQSLCFNMGGCVGLRVSVIVDINDHAGGPSRFPGSAPDVEIRPHGACVIAQIKQ